LVILKKLNLKEKEKDVLERYIWLPGEKIEISLEKYDRWKTIKEYDKGVVYKYLDVSYRFPFFQRNMLFSEVISLDFIGAFGRGYEHLFDGVVPMNMRGEYIKEKNLMSLPQWFDIGRIRRYIINSNITEAVKHLEILIQDCGKKANSPIRQTLLWMHENGLPGIGQIVEALGMDEICAEEPITAMEGINSFYRKEVVTLILNFERISAVALRHDSGHEDLLNVTGFFSLSTVKKFSGIQNILNNCKKGKESLDSYINSNSPAFPKPVIASSDRRSGRSNL